MSDTETQKPPTVITLTRGAIEMLTSCLTSQDWTKKRKEVATAGRLSERLEEATEGRPVYTGAVDDRGTPTNPVQYADHKKASKSWENEEVTLPLSDAEWQACVSTVVHYSDLQKIPGNRHGSTLLEQLKLGE